MLDVSGSQGEDFAEEEPWEGSRAGQKLFGEKHLATHLSRWAKSLDSASQPFPNFSHLPVTIPVSAVATDLRIPF